MSRVLVIGDTHCPAMHPRYLRFLNKIRDKWKTTRVVHIGDVVDFHCISFHEKHPDNPGALAEHKLACKQIKKLHEEFAGAEVCIGNHDRRPMRINSRQGVPGLYLKQFNDLYGTDTWKWVDSTTIDGVHYYHGEGSGGACPAMLAAKHRLCPVVLGHFHSACGVWYQVGPTAKIWGMSVGCGVDRDHWSMQYGAAFLRKPVVGCGVVIDGEPYVETMNL